MLALVCISGSSGLILTVYCVQRMRFGDAVLLLYTAPLFAGVLAKIVLKETFGVVNFTSAFACVLGTLFLMQPHMIFSKLSSPTDSSLTNCLLALLGAACLGVCYFSLRVQGPAVSPLVCLLWINVLLLPASIGVQLLIHQSYTLPQCGADRAALIVSGILMLASLYLFVKALAADITAPAVLMRNVDVAVAYGYQVLWFKEPLDVLSVIGLVMVVGAVSAVFLHKLLKNASCSFSSSPSYVQLEEGERNANI